MPAVYALAAFAMTLAGGAFAFRYQRYLLYIMAFSSGLLIGVAFLDLVPEVAEIAFHEAVPIRWLMTRVIAFQLSFFAGFLLYLGASDLLPQVHARPRRVLIAATLGGLATAGALVYALQSRA